MKYGNKTNKLINILLKKNIKICVAESITGGNATSVTGTKIFKSISSISSSGNGLGNLKIGIKASGYNLYLNHLLR